MGNWTGVASTPFNASPSRAFYAAAQDQPSTGEILSGGFLAETFQGTGSFVGMVRAGEQYFAQTEGKPITADEWKSSRYYRDGLQYPENGLTTSGADLLAKEFDARKKREDLIAKANGWQTALGVTTSIAAGISDPVNVLSGVAASALMGPAGVVLPGLRSLKTAARVGAITKRAKAVAGVAAVEGAIGAAITEPFAIAAAGQLQDDYTLADSMFNLATSALFSAGLAAVPRVYGRARMTTDERAVMDTFHESVVSVLNGKTPEPEIAASVGMAQGRVDAQVNYDTVLRQYEDSKAMLSDAERLNVFVREKVDFLEREAAFAEYGIRADELPEGVNPDEVLAAARALDDGGMMRAQATENAKFLTAVRSLGGLKEEDGELAAMGISGRGRILNNKSGLAHDEMALRLWEKGLLGTPQGERPTVNELRDRLAQAVRGKKTEGETITNADAAENYLAQNGIEINRNPEAASEIRAEAERLRQSVQGEDSLAAMRKKVSEYEAELRRYPSDREIASNARTYVNDMLSGENTTLYPPADTDPVLQTDISAFSDFDQAVIKELEALEAEWKGAGEELPAGYKKADEELRQQVKELEAAFYCITGR